jgi:exonuclease VII small subunit
MIGEKIEKLRVVTEWFGSEDFALDEAEERYREAVKLAREIEKDLEGLKNRIEVIGNEGEAVEKSVEGVDKLSKKLTKGS